MKIIGWNNEKERKNEKQTKKKKKIKEFDSFYKFAFLFNLKCQSSKVPKVMKKEKYH